MNRYYESPTFLSRHEIDDKQWNAHIHNALQAVAYAFTFYLDNVCESWEALVWRPVGFTVLMPLPIRRKWGKAFVYQPLFCQYLGFFSDIPLRASLVDTMLRAVFSKYNFISAYHFHPDNTHALLSGRLNFPDITLRQMRTHWLYLDNKNKNPENSFTHDRREQLRKSRNAGWELRFSKDINPLIALFDKHHAQKITGGVHPLAYQQLQRLVAALQTNECATIRYALKDGILCAGILLVSICGKTIYLFNAANETGRRGHARTFLLAEYFQHALDEPVIFDFESPEIPAIAQFYGGFGADTVAFYGMRRNALTLPLRIVRSFRNVRRVRKS